VDDNPYEIEELRAAGKPTIVFDHIYNQHVDGPRARGWGELVPMVLEQLTPNPAQATG
jgi:hypothetical protein